MLCKKWLKNNAKVVSLQDPEIVKHLKNQSDFNKVIISIAAVKRQSISERIKLSPLHTDHAVKSNIIIYIQFMDCGGKQIEFLCIRELADSTSAGIVAAIVGEDDTIDLLAPVLIIVM